MKDFISKKNKKKWQKNILSWYLLNKRSLPWREEKNQDFYSIWISEIMLQQTQVKTVIPYFLRFKKRWPDLGSFSTASLSDILEIWLGLGYYRRVKNIHETAKILKYNEFKSYDEIINLPGIGSYTAAAISAILYKGTNAVVDGNIKRILSRAFNIDLFRKKNKNTINRIAQELTPANNKDYCQALMDLGSLICKPKKPKCQVCPVTSCCEFFKFSKNQEIILNKNKNRNKKVKKVGITFYIQSKSKVFVQISESNFLYGLSKFPLSNLVVVKKSSDEDIIFSVLKKQWTAKNKIKARPDDLGFVKHNFTGFNLKLYIVKINLYNKSEINLDGIWCDSKQLSKNSFSKLMQKVKQVVAIYE